MSEPAAGAIGLETLRHAGTEVATLRWIRVSIDNDAVAACHGLVTLAEWRHARRHRLERDRRRCLVRRAAVRRLLGGALGRDSSMLQLRRTRLGKPYLLDAPIDFNVSYADDLVLLATSTVGAIGCDIARRDFEGTAWPHADALFSEHEVATMHAGALPAGDGFIRAWTLKEAWGKAIGCGLLGALDGFDTTRVGGCTSSVTCGDVAWIARCWERPAGYQTAIVVAQTGALHIS